MPNRVNELLMKDYVERFRDAEYLIAVGYEGLDVERTNAFRGEIIARDMRIRFVKNRIAKLAFEQMGVDGTDLLFEGQVAFVAGDDPVAMARTIRDFAKENEEVAMRGAVIENTVIGPAEATGLADAASKEELKGQIAGAAMGPGARIGGALLGPGGMVAGCVASLIDKLEEEGGEAA